MENQHRKIAGYRELSQQEIDLMNQIKAQGGVISGLIANLRELRDRDFCALDGLSLPAQADGSASISHAQLAESREAINTAETHLKTGVMWLVRAVALPTTF